MSKAKPADKSDDVLRPLPHALGCEKSVLSSILQEPEKHIRLCRNENIRAEDFYLPAHSTLYKVIMDAVNDGKEIELISLVQWLLDLGLLDRIGGPAAITDIYTYAPSPAHFQAHLDEVKNKAVLRKVIQDANEVIAQAYDNPAEVTQLLDIQRKNLEETVIKTESRNAAFKRFKERIVVPDAIENGVVSYLNGDRLLGGDPFFLPDYDLAFRKHECTVWLGLSFHGKSQAVQNQIAYLLSLQRRCMIASMEQPPEVTIAQIINAFTADPNFVKSPEFKAAYNYIMSLLTVYKGQERATPKHIVETFRQAYLNDGTDNFFVDNLMTMAVDRGDNSALAHAIDLFRMFVADYPAHLHLVTHPRKPADDQLSKPPTQNAIRGPAEIGDMPNNVIVVWRDMEKQEALAEMAENNYTDEEIQKFFRSTPCCKLVTRKQRTTGRTPSQKAWFHQETNRFMPTPGIPYPMYETKPW